MEKVSVVHIGGNIEQALKGEYKISPKQVLMEAWRNTLRNRASINGGLLIVLLIGVFATMVLAELLGGLEAVNQDPQRLSILNLAVTIIIWPFLAGVEMMGIFQVVGLKTESKQVFAFLKRGSWVAIAALLSSVLVGLGLQLFIVPGIFLAVCFSLIVPLVVEKKLSPLQAIVLSVKVMRFQWFNIFAVYVPLAFALVLIMIPLSQVTGVATFFALALFIFCLSYLAPLYFHAKGVLYREIYGMTLNAESAPSINSTDSSGTFDA
ncbi:hypothetical protein LP316_12175 [Thalassotalea sp. LPB0316]|uniref:hypothetical protein n=1 Tax=Thalassotalea sp. LPB0316 TaxID=2769490 RepID=UPI001865B708|nr:hypothetical protein [Thalassotalea sp. LPB0316]QOL25055.1 hypothetical protein LP316_12175 [Thalassotalea sp. LPB0316]